MVIGKSTIRRARASAMTQQAIRLAFRGNNVRCPCCGNTFRRLRDLNAPNRVCWTCGSLERHRSLALYFGQHPELFTPGMRILHIAPESALRRSFPHVPGLDYVGGDLTADFGSERIDVTDMHQFADNSFDAVLCNHVLEHVPDDAAGMSEIRRVLKPPGWATLLVPMRGETTDEDPSVTDHAERNRRFGQWDHVRYYGLDYLDRLRAFGLAAELVDPLEIFPIQWVYRCRLKKLGEVEPLVVVQE